MVLGATFGLVFGVLIGTVFNYLIVGIASGISLGIVIGSTINRNDPFNKKIQISGKTAEAMASKIIFEAEQHRKNQDRYNNIKSSSKKEEKRQLNIHKEYWQN